MLTPTSLDRLSLEKLTRLIGFDIEINELVFPF